ncbi:MAG TPA: AAA family ATPase, partial [bacterium]|nr:AAA family ATPase [bacterium]
NWENQCICLSGPRGVGKTTLLIQHYLEKYGSPELCLYISGDNINVISNGLYNIAREHFKYGGKAIIIDEIHKYPNWAQELKNSIDTYKNGKFIISGSSSLDLIKAKYDLSRRVVYYNMKGFSFREYLSFAEGIDLPVLNLNEILKNHSSISTGICSKTKILKHFDKYMTHGYYPFILEGKDEYFQKVLNCIEKVLYEDIAVIFNLTQPKLPILKKMLWLISTSNPFVPNIAGMSRDLGISKEYVYSYLEFLETAGILNSVNENTEGAKLVRKAGKIYFENPNIPVAINGAIKKETLTGMMRETFFLNQLNLLHKVSLHKQCDFLVDDTFSFEIGDPSKKTTQIKEINDGLVAMDGIETGYGRKIPLYLFGFMY